MRLIVVGGGAAGVFAACNAAAKHPDMEVILLEQSSNLLSKVKVSGGGRCNLTHNCSEIGEMIKKYPRGKNFLKKSFHEFFTNDTINWFESRGVKLKTEPDGRMFPVTNNSQTIIDILIKELNIHRVKIYFRKKVVNINKNQQWEVECLNNEIFKTDFLCIACGGLNKSSMFEFLQKTGHNFIPPVPSLFTFNLPLHPLKELMGIAVENAKISIPVLKKEESGPLLITHWGYSGPVVLKLSSFAARDLHNLEYNFKIRINWTGILKEPELKDIFSEKRNSSPSALVVNKVLVNIPSRLWKLQCYRSGITDNTRFADLSSTSRQQLINHILFDEYTVKGKTTFKEEFVTAGGIDLKEVNPLTMESRLHHKLFFAGEVLDVDGITGGFNFQHAWTSGYIASRLGESE